MSNLPPIKGGQGRDSGSVTGDAFVVFYAVVAAIVLVAVLIILHGSGTLL